MPGSPAISSTEPRTKPPPVTRSNSARPDARRGASWVSPVSGCSAKLRPLRGARPGPAGRPATPPKPARPSPSSTIEFHSPQASHLPCQRAEAAPQFWQTNVRLRRDMRKTGRSRGTQTLAGESEQIKNINGRGSHLPDAVEAAAEVGQHLIGDGAGLVGDVVE